MARSTYIYVVYIDLVLTSAFTVKHEMIDSLPDEKPSVLQVYRLRDGRNSEIVDITAQISEETYE